jgi:hypothetical protein
MAQAPASDDSQQSRVGILFLAHDGVANQDVWEGWRNQSEVRWGPFGPITPQGLGQRPKVLTTLLPPPALQYGSRVDFFVFCNQVCGPQLG